MNILSSFYLADETNAMIRRAVESRGWNFLESPTDKNERAAHIDAHIGDADAYYGGRLTSEQWKRTERLKWIHNPWAGVNSLLAARGDAGAHVIITTSSGIMADSVADQTFGMIVM